MNNELYHYGVPGMKWGVKRTQSKLSRIEKKSAKQNWSNDATEAAKISIKKLNQMSNAELQKLNNRKQLERNYKQLNPKAIAKGIAVAGTIAAGMGTIIKLRSSNASLINMGKNTVKSIIKTIKYVNKSRSEGVGFIEIGKNMVKSAFKD